MFFVLFFFLFFFFYFFFFQAEDGIRDLVRSRGLGDVYKRQDRRGAEDAELVAVHLRQLGRAQRGNLVSRQRTCLSGGCLLYTLTLPTSAADERSSVDLGGRRIIKKKKTRDTERRVQLHITEEH